jgi:hypothetical protein
VTHQLDIPRTGELVPDVQADRCSSVRRTGAAQIKANRRSPGLDVQPANRFSVALGAWVRLGLREMVYRCSSYGGNPAHRLMGDVRAQPSEYTLNAAHTPAHRCSSRCRSIPRRTGSARRATEMVVHRFSTSLCTAHTDIRRTSGRYLGLTNRFFPGATQPRIAEDGVQVPEPRALSLPGGYRVELDDSAWREEQQQQAANQEYVYAWLHKQSRACVRDEPCMLPSMSHTK